MTAEIITVGDELLIGQVVDTNSAWIGETLSAVGIRVGRITSISDSAPEITNAITEALSRASIVITTGGLGPTKDDITKHTIARYFGVPLVRDQITYQFIEQMLTSRGIGFNALNQSQALVPKGCTVIPNRNGTAPGMWFTVNEKVLIALPGVPFEMKSLINDEVLPRLNNHFQLKSNVHRTAVTFGLPESTLAQTIAAWEDALPTYLHLAYLPNPESVRLRLSAYDMTQAEGEGEIYQQFQRLEQIIPDFIVGYGDTTLASATGALLQQRGEQVACAESCTGGNIAHQITSLPGASAYFLGGVVAYDNRLKTGLLGVDPNDLAREGAVSACVAEQMAAGVCRATGAAYGIATTGVAGPTGGTKAKPVGTVWFGLHTPATTRSVVMQLGHLRAQNIARATAHALNLLRLELLKN